MQLPAPAIARAIARQDQQWRTAKLMNMFGRCKAIVHEADVCDCVVAEFPPEGFGLMPQFKSPGAPYGEETSQGETLRSRQCPTCFAMLPDRRDTCDWCNPGDEVYGEDTSKKLGGTSA